MRLKNKRIQAIIILIITALIVLSGTYAWYSFNQRRVNIFELSTKPGVNLHDDFAEGPDKDVYVENSGAVGLYVRVRLTEYMETVNRGSLIAGHSRGLAEGENETDIARMQWSPHSGTGHAANCTIRNTDTINNTWNASDNFHEYYVWTMGGQKYYKPAILQHPDTALSDDPEVCVDTKTYTGTEQNVKQTLTAFVITMEQWINGGYIKPNGEAMLPNESGKFWVVDTDGWCYWAQMLNPGEATGLLLDKVERTSKQFDSDVEYCINVWLQAIDLSEIERLPYDENGGVTSNAELLLNVLVTGAMVANDGSLYEDNDDGTFVTVIDKDGNTIAEPKAFVPVGNFTAESPSAVKAGAPEENRIYLGDTVNIEKLLWDGETYINYDMLFEFGAPFYNITVAEGGQYTVIGTEVGADGNVYLCLEDGGGNLLYITSVLEVSAFAPESQTNYVQGYPGTGPFGFIYKPDEAEPIGTDNDLRHDPATYEERFFYHIGSGVYIEVADKNSTASHDEYVANSRAYNEDVPEENTTYYFSNTIYPKNPLMINNTNGEALDDNVNAAFVESLQIGQFFGYYDAPNTGYCTIYKGEDIAYHQDVVKDISRTFTMKPIYKHTDGQLYIEAIYQANEPGREHDVNVRGKQLEDYTDFFIKGMGENGEFGGQVFGQQMKLDDGEMTIPSIQPPQGGGQSSADPFEIENRAQMDWVTTQVMSGRSFANEYLVVVNDIDMGDLDFAPIGDSARPFLGVFDGDGKTIDGLTIDGTGNYIGLFGYIGAGGVAKNINLTDVSIRGNSRAGGIAGHNDGTVIDCSSNGELISVAATSTDAHFGSIVGYNNGEITRCTSAGAWTVGGYNSRYYGGIAGYNTANGTILDCVNTSASPQSGYYVGGIVGMNLGTIDNCENKAAITATYYLGGITGRNGSSSNNTATIRNCTNSANVDIGYNECGGITGNNFGTIENSRNTGKVYAGSYSGGIAGKNSGTVGGDTKAKGCTNSGEVSGWSIVGGIVGESNSAAAIVENCDNLAVGVVNNNSKYTGGVAGYNAGTVRSSTNKAAVSGGEGTGGVVGTNFTATAKIIDCQNDGNVTGNADANFIGGVAGGNNIGASISGSSNKGVVKGLADLTGGVAGSNNGSVQSSSNSGPVTGSGNNTGGIAGINSGTINGGQNTGNVTGDGNYTGGVAGDSSGAITGVHNSGNVTGTGSGVAFLDSGYVGGIAGRSTATITNCTNSGSIEGKGDSYTADGAASGNNVGGIAGYSNAAVAGCSNTGNVKGFGSLVAGVVGYNFSGGVVENSFNVPSAGKKIEGYGGGAGGVAGLNSGTVKNSFSVSEVYGENLPSGKYAALLSSTGGVVGRNQALMENCYAWGNVTGKDSTGGVVGNNTNTGTVANCYYANGAISGKNGVGGIAGSSTNLAANIVKNSVTLASSVSASDGTYVNKAIGLPADEQYTSLYPQIYPQCYSISNMTVIPAANSGYAGISTGTPITHMVQVWWSSGTVVGFDFTAGTGAWRWDSVNSLPVLQGVTP